MDGSKGGLLTPEEKITVWERALTDMQFLQSTFGISYTRPDVTSLPLRFSGDFLHRLADIMPKLSEPVRLAMLQFLLQRAP